MNPTSAKLSAEKLPSFDNRISTIDHHALEMISLAVLTDLRIPRLEFSGDVHSPYRVAKRPGGFDVSRLSATRGASDPNLDSHVLKAPTASRVMVPGTIPSVCNTEGNDKTPSPTWVLNMSTAVAIHPTCKSESVVKTLS
jgi:hypothetical protein